MKIGVLGTGRMGKAIDVAVAQTAHTIIFRCDDEHLLTPELATQADVIIDFTIADCLQSNLEIALQNDVPFVTGTTGWDAQRGAMSELVQEYNGSFLHAANFSIGVALFRMLASQAARLFDAVEKYDFGIHEIHHTGKADSPSGTAILLGDTMLDKLSSKTRLVYGNSKGKIARDALQISSQRVGAIPGTHRIFIDSTVDSIELTHTAHGREGFAAGSIWAAEWLIGKTGFFTLDDMLADILPKIE